jgi:uncharacterized protein YcfJ
MRFTVIVLALALIVSSCAHSFVDTYEPVIDTQNIDSNRYASDLRDCRAFAVREDPATKAAQGALAGVVVGALLGAALGSSFGQAGRGAGIGAGIGAVEGGAIGTVGGAASGVEAQQIIVKRCLSRRGYQVLF